MSIENEGIKVRSKTGNRTSAFCRISYERRVTREFLDLISLSLFYWQVLDAPPFSLSLMSPDDRFSQRTFDKRPSRCFEAVGHFRLQSCCRRRPTRIESRTALCDTPVSLLPSLPSPSLVSLATLTLESTDIVKLVFSLESYIEQV